MQNRACTQNNSGDIWFINYKGHSRSSPGKKCPLELHVKIRNFSCGRLVDQFQNHPCFNPITLLTCAVRTVKHLRSLHPLTTCSSAFAYDESGDGAESHYGPCVSPRFDDPTVL
ncbi:hypothetical protein BaRGS_00016764 [Batillaria attramentaria]|uniref:Uncharacterized protein n=1 Tax=Batillaria attramentaria TaxID=370345 RepID=A0ABD0KXB9_9CAEN